MKLVPVLATTLVLGFALSACSLVGDRGGPSARPSGTSSTQVGGKVVLVTHSDFALPKKLIRSFEADSGIDLQVRAAGDAGTLASQLALNADHPLGDVAFGLDNTFAERPLQAGAFDDLEVPLPAGVSDYALPGDDGEKLAPVDNGDVCVNVDTDWFAAHHQQPPAGMDDLTKPAYKGLFVTSSPVSSSPGMAFLLATISKYGDGWQGYWRDLLGNDTEIADSWSDAYYGDFTQGGQKGTRPIVLSYSSDPAFTVSKDGRSTSTQALLDTCFRQVEYAGVLAGADNPAGARAVVEWLMSADVQGALPDSMYVFPVRDGVALPKAWAKFAKRPDQPWQVDPARIADQRETWLEQWRDLAS
jgi:thiamine transport system substrate-binding protein